MVNATKRNLSIIRGATEGFLTQYFPAELVVLPVVWNRLLEMRKECKDAREWQRITGNTPRYEWSLAFADVGTVNLVAPLVIVTLLATFEELARAPEVRVAEASVQQWREAVQSCARIFKAPRNLQERMLAYLPNTLHQILAEGQMHREQKVGTSPQRVGVSPAGQVRVGEADEGQSMRPRQTGILLCHLVRKGRVHWLEGMLLLESWSRRPPRSPLDSFRSLVSKTNKALEDFGVGLSIEPGVEGARDLTGVWSLRVKPDTILVGGVVEAQQLLEQAKAAREGEEVEKAFDLALRAFETDPTNVEAAELVLDFPVLIARDTRVLGQLKRYLLPVRRFEAIATGALKEIARLSAEGKTKHADAVVEFETSIRMRLRDAQAQISRSATLTQKKRICHPEDQDLLALDEVIRALHDPRRAEKAANALRANAIMMEVIDKAAAQCLRIPNLPSSVRNRELLDHYLWKAFVTRVCRGGKPVFEYRDTSHLKSCWILLVAREATEEMVEDLVGIDRSTQKKVRRYWSAKRRIDKVERPASDETLCEALLLSAEDLRDIERLSGMMWTWSLEGHEDPDKVDSEEYRKLYGNKEKDMGLWEMEEEEDPSDR